MNKLNKEKQAQIISALIEGNSLRTVPCSETSTEVCSMQANSVIIMTPRQSNENPEGVTAVWRTVHKLESDVRTGFTALRTEIKAQRFALWRWIWAERNWLFPVALTVLGLIVSGIWYVGGIILDAHIGIVLKDTTNDIATIKGNVGDIQSSITVLRAQVTAQSIAAVPRLDLKKHSGELQQARASLAAVNGSNTTAGFWPVSFQIINLLSQANSSLMISDQQESSLDDVSSNPPGGISPITNRRVVLRNLVGGITFVHSIVRFDPSVKLINDTFIDCIFIFPDSMANPPKPLREIGTALLTSDISRAIITAS
jgi:hypothetical protein